MIVKREILDAGDVEQIVFQPLTRARTKLFDTLKYSGKTGISRIRICSACRINYARLAYSFVNEAVSNQYARRPLAGLGEE